MRPFLLAWLLLADAAIVAAQKPSDPPDPLTVLPSDTIVAVVDGQTIQLRDLEAFSRTKDSKKLFQLNQQLFEFRESMLNLMLGERLLKLEAEKTGLSVEALLERNLKVEPVTDAEINEILARQPNLDRAVVAPLVRQFLEDRKKEEARTRYIAELIAQARKGPKPLVINLQPPRQAISVSDSDPIAGSGPVQVIEFSDFECPFCARMQPILKGVLAQFSGKVTHVWKDYPLPIHKHAIGAAAAARCAHEQGKFWEYHDLLFANQAALSAADLKKHARTIALDGAVFDTCMDKAGYRDQVQEAVKAAEAYAVPATPTVFINGRIVVGVAPPDAYTRIITEELGI
jgi:protein-disulfide isomerase